MRHRLLIGNYNISFHTPPRLQHNIVCQEYTALVVYDVHCKSVTNITIVTLVTFGFYRIGCNVHLIKKKISYKNK